MDRPTKLEELDLLRVTSLAEQERRINAELALLQLQATNIGAEKAEVDKRKAIVGAMLTAKYGLAAADQIDPATGSITWAKKPYTPPALQTVPAPKE
jgi:hypothetical protein